MICIDCGNEFELPKRKEPIKAFRPTYRPYCSSCNAARAREFRKANPGYKTTGKVVKYPKEDRKLVSAIRSRLRDAIGRCIKFGRPLPTVTVDDLYTIFKTQNGNCALSNAPLTLDRKHPLSLSLDQKNPSEGYTKDNVQWLAWCVNRAKGDLIQEDFLDMCEVITQLKVQRLSKGS